jgi:hypothetical protein
MFCIGNCMKHSSISEDAGSEIEFNYMTQAKTRIIAALSFQSLINIFSDIS